MRAMPTCAYKDKYLDCLWELFLFRSVAVVSFLLMSVTSVIWNGLSFILLGVYYPLLRKFYLQLPLSVPWDKCYCTAHFIPEVLEPDRSFHWFSPFIFCLTNLDVQVRSLCNPSNPISKVSSVFNNPSILMVKQWL